VRFSSGKNLKTSQFKPRGEPP